MVNRVGFHPQVVSATRMAEIHLLRLRYFPILLSFHLGREAMARKHMPMVSHEYALIAMASAQTTFTLYSLSEQNLHPTAAVYSYVHCNDSFAGRFLTRGARVQFYIQKLGA